MADMTKAELIHHIKKTLTELWLYDAFGECEPIGIRNRTNAINALGQVATIALDTGRVIQSTSLDSVLIELHDLQFQDISDAEQTLHRILSEISPGKAALTDQDKMSALASLVAPIVQGVRLKPTYEEARHNLEILNRVATVAARLAFAGEAELSGLMDVLVSAFEHAEEEPVMRLIYGDIMSGELLEGFE